MHFLFKAATLRGLVCAAAIALLGACGDGSGDDIADGGNAVPAAGDDSGSPPGPAASVCGGPGFPCALSQVSREVLDRGEQLADQALKMLDGGSSMADTLALLRSQTDMADVASQGRALRFRLHGGRDVFILSPASGATTAAGLAIAPAVAPVEAGRKHIASAVGGDGTHLVVGNNTSNKHALVLSPFKHEFGAEDDGAGVAQLLQGTRGYAGNVVYKENATPASAVVGLQQFMGWEAFDVIHVASHGAQICDVNRCVSIVLSGDSYVSAADLLRITELGINTVRLRGSDRKLLSLGPDFFKAHYPQGLAHKIIFFNACQTFGAAGSGLSDVLLGADSVFLGWTDVVQSPAARAAALALYDRLSKTGITVQAAADGLGDLAFNRYKDGDLDITAILLLDHAPQTALRLREVATLERPSGGGELLSTSVINAVGKANDGVVDGVPYQILIEGIPASQQDAAIVTFTVNGHASTPQAVTIGERVGDTGWRLRGQIPFIDVDAEQVVQVTARVQLPEGGSSEHRVSVKLVSEPPLTAETWVGEAVSHFDDDTPEGQTHITRVATVTFKQSAASVGGRYKVLRSTAGSMTWTRSGTIKTLQDGFCAYAGDAVTLPIAEGDGEIIIDTAAAPDSYTMSGFTSGVVVRMAENCGSYAFSTRAGGSWAPALATSDRFAATPDGGMLSGSTALKQTTWQWTFKRQ
jgi:hypothetical protein